VHGCLLRCKPETPLLCAGKSKDYSNSAKRKAAFLFFIKEPAGAENSVKSGKIPKFRLFYYRLCAPVPNIFSTFAATLKEDAF